MTLSSKLVPSSGCLFGVYPGSSCDSATSDLTRLRNHETKIDRTSSTGGILNFVNTYHDWNDFTSNFPTANEQVMSDEGRILLIHWSPRIFGTSTQFLWADIAAGVHDATYVDPTARAMRDFGRTLFLAFHNEMNLGSSAQGGTYGTDAEYASAAQHIHDRFAVQGATNVVWVFKPSGYTATISRMNTLYGANGDNVFDWIGFDPYGNSSASDTVDYVLSTKYPMVTWATVTKSGSHTKPMMLAEWAKTEVSGQPNAKAQWYADLEAALKIPPYNIIKAICYFNSTAGISECFDTSDTTLKGYKVLAGDSFYNPDRSPTPPPVSGGVFRAAASASFNNTASKDIVIPGGSSGVQVGDVMRLYHASTRTGLKNGCEGTNAATVTAGNSNTVGSNPLDALSAGSIPTYSTAQFHSGTSSWHPAVAATSVSQARWDASFGTPSTYYGRMYFRIPSIPTNANTRIYQQSAGPTGTPNQWGIGIDGAGKLIVRDIPNASTKWTSTATPAVNTWHRVEWKASWDGTNTTITIRPYFGASVDSTTATETPAAFTLPQAAAAGQFQFGIFSTAQTWDCFIDDVMLDVNAFPGPSQTYPALTAPSGWSLVDTKQVSTGGGDLSGKCFQKVATGGDPGSTLTLATDVNAHGSILLVARPGVDSVLDIEASNSATSDGTTVTSPNVTTLTAADLIESAFFARDNPGGLTTSWTTPLIGVGPDREAQRAASFGAGTADGRVAGLVCDDGLTHAIGTYGAKVATSGNAVTSHLKIAFTLAIKTTAAVATGQHAGFIYFPA